MTSRAPKLINKKKNFKKRTRDKQPPKPNAWAVALEQYFLDDRFPARAKQQLLDSIEETLDAPDASPMHYTVEERDTIFDAHDAGRKRRTLNLRTGPDKKSEDDEEDEEDFYNWNPTFRNFENKPLTLAEKDATVLDASDAKDVDWTKFTQLLDLPCAQYNIIDLSDCDQISQKALEAIAGSPSCRQVDQIDMRMQLPPKEDAKNTLSFPKKLRILLEGTNAFNTIVVAKEDWRRCSASDFQEAKKLIVALATQKRSFVYYEPEFESLDYNEDKYGCICKPAPDHQTYVTAPWFSFDQ